MGFEHWEVGFRKKMGWEMGLVPRLPPPPFQDPLKAKVATFTIGSSYDITNTLTVNLLSFFVIYG